MDAAMRIRLAAGTLPQIRDLKKLVLPPRICGVYFLIDGQDVVYVGQSADVVRRVNEHHDRDRKTFETAMYLPCSLGELDELEEYFINTLKPRFNGQYRRMGTAAYVRHILQASGPLTFEEIVRMAPEHGVWAQCPASMTANISRALQRDTLVHRCAADGTFRSVDQVARAAEVQ